MILLEGAKATTETVDALRTGASAMKAMGKVNEITESEIKSADLVLIAADKVVEDEDRFAGKQIVRVKIGQCVSNAEGVLKKIVEAMEKRK